MALNFPLNPDPGATYDAGDVVYIYDGTKWIVPVGVVTPGYLEARISGIEIPELPSDLITEPELEHRLSQLPEPEVTPHDVELAAQAVDAKFDMLRAAIEEATDFDTLKVRLLAVLA